MKKRAEYIESFIVIIVTFLIIGYAFSLAPDKVTEHTNELNIKSIEEINDEYDYNPDDVEYTFDNEDKKVTAYYKDIDREFDISYDEITNEKINDEKQAISDYRGEKERLDYYVISSLPLMACIMIVAGKLLL